MKNKRHASSFILNCLTILFIAFVCGKNLYASQIEEVEWLQPPQQFERMSEENLNRPGVQPLVSMMLPNFEAVWFEPKTSSMIVMGRTKLDRSKVLGLSKTAFLKEVDAVGKAYKQKLEAQHQNCQSSYRISNMGNMLVLTVSASFPDVSDDTIHHRYIVFYNADYRLDVVVEAGQRPMTTFEPALTESIVAFLNDLSRRYPSGIEFSG